MADGSFATLFLYIKPPANKVEDGFEFGFIGSEEGTLAVSGGGSPLDGDWAITRTFETANGDTIQNVRMSLVGIAGKSVITKTDGIATIMADDNTFTLRVVPPAGYEPVADLALTINGADSVETVVLTPSALPATVTPEEVYQIFGRVNVNRWADLDGDENLATIVARINASIATELQYVIDRVGHTYDTSTLTDSLAVRDMIARMVGVSLYQARGYEDDDSKLIKLHQARIDSVLKFILTGRLKFPGVARTTSHPDVST
jgi:hypothetical protein